MARNITATTNSTNTESNSTISNRAQLESIVIAASGVNSKVESNKPITFKSLLTAKAEKPQVVESDPTGKDLSRRIDSFMSRESVHYPDFTRLAKDGQALIQDCETYLETVKPNIELYNQGFIAKAKGFLSGRLNGKSLDKASVRVDSYVILASDKLARIQVLDGKFETEAKQYELQAQGYASLTVKALQHGKALAQASKVESDYSKVIAKNESILKTQEQAERAESAYTKLLDQLAKAFCSETGIPLTSRDYRVTTYYLGGDNKLKANNPRLVSREVVNKLKEDGVKGLGIEQVVTERAVTLEKDGLTFNAIEKITYSVDSEFGELVRVKRENLAS
jgi:hypothetical protein